MSDRSAFWSAPPAADMRLTGDGITVDLLPPLPQLMVSGDLDAFCSAHELAPPAGLLGKAQGAAYALRLARNRLLAVGVSQDHAAAGWQDGAAVTPVTGALAVFAISGPAAMDLIARGTAIDPRRPGPSAALLFAGVNAVLYRYESSLRLHVDRGLTSYFTGWCRAAGLEG